MLTWRALQHPMITKIPYLTLAALVLTCFTAKADDYAWGSTTGASMVQIDATTGKLQSLNYNGTAYTNFVLLNSATNNQLGSSLWLAQNSNGTLYGLSNSGTLYTIVTTLAQDVNKDTGFFATQIGSVGNSVTGSTFVTSNLLDFSSGSNLYQYNLTTKATANLGSFSNNANVSGLAYGASLYGVQYSPSPGAIELVSGVNLTPFPNSSFNGANGQSSLFVGTSVIYLADGNSSFYSYNPSTGTLAVIANNFPGGLHSLTPISVAGGGGTPTPTPTPTATPTPTPTPTPTATPNVKYAVPTGTLTVTAPETTPQLQCAPGYQYSATESSSIPNGGTFDPHGSLGVYRYCETASSTGTYANPPATTLQALALLTSVAVNDNFWPANSGFANIRAFGPYTAAQDCNAVALGDNYGRETLALVYTMGDNTQYVLDTKVIYLYPWNTGSQASAPTALISNALTRGLVQGNYSPYAGPSPTPSPYLHGDPPRVTVQMNNLYPAGTSWVIIYSGTPISNPTATGYAVIANTTATAPAGGLWTNRPAVTFELASPTPPNYVSTTATTPQTYTLAAVQQLPSSAYAIGGLNPAILNSVTFTFAAGYSVNGTVGTVK
jgi:hypothetical protein